jgi:(p)ppGpp synthase/HD superfamily hydrolase
MPALSPRFDAAFQYASRLHRDQVRKGSTIPYLSHLLAVAAMVLENGGTEDQAVAALLHDAVEDQPRGGQTESEIGARFGAEVRRIVLALSDATGHPKPPWRDRKLAYLERLKDEPADVLLISLADKLHNARSILADYYAVGDAVWGRFNSDRKDHLWYYRELVETFADSDEDLPQGLLDELDRVVTELEEG